MRFQIYHMTLICSSTQHSSTTQTATLGKKSNSMQNFKQYKLRMRSSQIRYNALNMMQIVSAQECLIHMPRPPPQDQICLQGPPPVQTFHRLHLRLHFGPTLLRHRSQPLRRVQQLGLPLAGTKSIPNQHIRKVVRKKRRQRQMPSGLGSR